MSVKFQKQFFLLLFAILSSVKMGAQSVITFDIGEYKVSAMTDSKMNGKPELLIGATPAMIQEYYPDGTFPLEVNTFLVRTPNKKILIDAGTGGELSDNLKLMEVTPEQIDEIFLTHMHGDHIGGLLKDNEPVFSNATLYISKKEAEFQTSSEKGEGARKVLKAYKNKLKLFDPEVLGSEKTELSPGIWGIAAYGHTPGHTAFLIKSDDTKLLIWGDITHAIDIQVAHPTVALSFDNNSETAIETRKNILKYVVKNKIPVGGMHIPFPGIGNVRSSGQTYSFEAFCTCLGY
ncbi:MBL fold hydrolase [Bacteroidia bacterium]|nr:MBL fold hydrolase [Bacteroidia bacterium]